MRIPRYGRDNPMATYAISNFRPVMDWVWGSQERTTVLFGTKSEVIRQVLGDSV
jgi:hypothetical protein